MARSIRSKRGRKMRAMKREKYAKKELTKLKETVKDLGVQAVANPDRKMIIILY